MPWNLIAGQLLGDKGLAILERDESKPDHNTPPADTLWLCLVPCLACGQRTEAQ